MVFPIFFIVKSKLFGIDNLKFRKHINPLDNSFISLRNKKKLFYTSNHVRKIANTSFETV